MAKLGEIAYVRNLKDPELQQAVNKPFSDPKCGHYLCDMGMIFTMLPPPPARLLDFGCGTGWTSVFFAQAGWDVVGVDICGDMIHHANQNRRRAGLANLRFLECDYEDLPFREEFDGCVFYDALHHAVDEELALRSALQALKSGGICVTSEPGRGHHDSREACEAIRRFGVTEKDMPVERIVALGQQLGFTGFQAIPWVREVYVPLFNPPEPPSCRDETTRNPWHLLKRRLKKFLSCPPEDDAAIVLPDIDTTIFPNRRAHLQYYRNLVATFSGLPQRGGMVRMVK